MSLWNILGLAAVVALLVFFAWQVKIIFTQTMTAGWVVIFRFVFYILAPLALAIWLFAINAHVLGVTL